MSKSNKQRFGIFYRSHNEWTGPYAGLSFTKYSLNRSPAKKEISWLKNYVLKSRIKICPVKS